MSDALTEMIERKEHDVLDERTWQEWAHSPRCVMCIILRSVAGETTMNDRLMVDSSGRPLLMPSRPC
jgi:hypothetical protein